jgi:hypothetical protein
MVIIYSHDSHISLAFSYDISSLYIYIYGVGCEPYPYMIDF